MQMQLARRSGHLDGKKIRPKNVDGHVQTLRLQLLSKDLDIPQPRWRRRKDKAGGDVIWEPGVIQPVANQTTSQESIQESDSGHTVTSKQENLLDGSTQPTVLIPDQPAIPCLEAPGAFEPTATEGSKALRFASDTLGGEKPRYPKWTFPNKPCDAVYRAGDGGVDSTDKIDAKPQWAAGVPPPDMQEFNFTQMEDGTRKLAAVDEAWKASYVHDPFFEMEMLPKYESELHVVDAWWTSEMPSVSPGVAPFIQEYMKQHEGDTTDLGILFQSALGKLRQEGMTTAGQMASASLIMWGQRHPEPHENNVYNMSDGRPVHMH